MSEDMLSPSWLGAAAQLLRTRNCADETIVVERAGVELAGVGRAVGAMIEGRSVLSRTADRVHVASYEGVSFSGRCCRKPSKATALIRRILHYFWGFVNPPWLLLRRFCP